MAKWKGLGRRVTVSDGRAELQVLRFQVAGVWWTLLHNGSFATPQLINEEQQRVLLVRVKEKTPDAPPISGAKRWSWRALQRNGASVGTMIRR